ncbi:MAG: FtsX-like permease family protein [Clostridiales bacterium]|nr:FtsX-like permease family protein [Clostridiales bacterium]
MRAFLTMLGIIIGVGAVTVIVGLGNGMKNYITKSFESMGTNLITVDIQGRGTSRTISVDDMYALVEQNPDLLSYVSPTAGVSGTVKIGNKNIKTTRVSGVSEDYMKISSSELTDGRFIQYVDVLRRQQVCVVGSYIAKTYYSGNAVGKTLKINGTAFTVVGVLKEEAKSEKLSSDDVIFIPYTNASKMSWTGTISSFVFSGASPENINKAVITIKEALYKVYGSYDYFSVVSMSEMLDSFMTEINVMVIVLGAIAAISLLVGGIGIMNIMLVSVTERTREIGIRKSLGAKQKDILGQFVIEAATTSALGGIMGILFGFLLCSIGTNIISSLAQETITVVPSFGAVLGAFSVSVGIGIIFGFLPAKKAAKLNPIDALRYD